MAHPASSLFAVSISICNICGAVVNWLVVNFDVDLSLLTRLFGAPVLTGAGPFLGLMITCALLNASEGCGVFMLAGSGLDRMLASGPNVNILVTTLRVTAARTYKSQRLLQLEHRTRWLSQKSSRFVDL